MGKHKLRFSHMIPNAWFYRLQDMTTKPLPSAYSSSTSKHHNHPRNSISYTPKVYTTNTIHDPPSRKHPIYTQPTESTDHTHQDSFLSPSSSGFMYPSSESTRSLDTPPSTSCNSGLSTTASTTDIQKLHPIITKPTKSKMESSNNMVDRNEISGIKIRSNSSKTRVSKKMVDDNDDDKRQKKMSSRCCIVKSTFDPEKDLKESMVEMIMENNIRESKDLEQLLAYYLSLNSNEYHDMIVKACEEIWLSFNLI